MLDDQLYDPVRAILGSGTEKKLKEFEIVPIEAAKEDDDKNRTIVDNKLPDHHFCLTTIK